MKNEEIKKTIIETMKGLKKFNHDEMNRSLASMGRAFQEFKKTDDVTELKIAIGSVIEVYQAQTNKKSKNGIGILPQAEFVDFSNRAESLTSIYSKI